MAIVAYDRSGNEIYAEDVESRGEFICVECEERVSYRRDYETYYGSSVRACFIHHKWNPECTLSTSNKELPDGWKPPKRPKPRFQYDEKNKKSKIQSQTIDNADSKIFLNKKQDFFNLSMMINISIESESTDNPDGKIKIKTLGGLREILIKDIENMSGPIQAFDIDSNFTQDNIELEGTIPPFISNLLEDNINFQERDAWILKDPHGTGLLFEGPRISLNYHETYAILINKDIDTSEFNDKFLQVEQFDDPNFMLFTFDISLKNQGKNSFDELTDQELIEKLGKEYEISWNTTPKISLIDPVPIRIEKSTIYIDPGTKECKFKVNDEMYIDYFDINVSATDTDGESTHEYKEDGKFIKINVSNAKWITIYSDDSNANLYYKVIKEIPKSNTYLGITILINEKSYNLLDQNLKNHLKHETTYYFSESIVNSCLDIIHKNEENIPFSYDGKEIDGGNFGYYQLKAPEVKLQLSNNQFNPSQKKILQWLRINAGIINKDINLDAIEKQIIEVYGEHSEFENHINYLKGE